MAGQILEKHERYLSPHKPNDEFWGIGLEEEFYLELEHPLRVTTQHILENQRAERYSVDYLTSFRPDVLRPALLRYLEQNKLPFHSIHILVNAHSLAATDSNGQPRTTYTKVPRPNPKFSGTTLHEILEEASPWYKNSYKKIFCYDGNTIEIMTQNFYKTTAEQVCEELKTSRQRFLEEIRPTFQKIPLFAQHGEIRCQTANHGLATYMTNFNHVNFCNNGTLHINLTMPTQLSAEAKPADETAFKQKHLQAARLIQWLEPLLLVIYGEPDFLSAVDGRFSACSQRGAISRYIGISNYDTNEAKEGKTVVTKALPEWYKKYHETSAYRQLEEVGFDIQFRKFPNHGLELRIFDRLPDSRILPLVRLLVHLLDRSLALSGSALLINAPQSYAPWNAWLVDVLQNGRKARADAAVLALYEELLGCRLPASGNPEEIYDVAEKHLENQKGPCAQKMLESLHVSVPESTRSRDSLHVIPEVKRKSILCCH